MSAPSPDYPKSTYITNVTFDKFGCHRGDGDMWPITWAEDGNLYGGAGDNSGSPMNFWRIHNGPQDWCANTGGRRCPSPHYANVNKGIRNPAAGDAFSAIIQGK